MVIGTLAVDDWYSEDGPGWAWALPSPLLAVPVTVHCNCLCTPNLQTVKLLIETEMLTIKTDQSSDITNEL